MQDRAITAADVAALRSETTGFVQESPIDKPQLWIDADNSPYGLYLKSSAVVRAAVPGFVDMLKDRQAYFASDPMWKKMVRAQGKEQRAASARYVLAHAALGDLGGEGAAAFLGSHGLLDATTVAAMSATHWTGLSPVDFVCAPKAASMVEKASKLDKVKLCDAPWTLRYGGGAPDVSVPSPTLRHLHAAFHGALVVERPTPPNHTLVLIDTASPLFGALLPIVGQAVKISRFVFLTAPPAGPAVLLAVEAQTLLAWIEQLISACGKMTSLNNGVCY